LSPARVTGEQLVEDLGRRGRAAADARRYSDAVERSSTCGETWHRRERTFDSRYPVEVADRVLGQGATPAGHDRIARHTPHPDCGGEITQCTRDELVISALKVGNVTMPADRAAHENVTRRVVPTPLLGRECRRFDQSTVDSRHQETAAR